MKIIAVDNFNTEMRSDYLICENINEYYGKFIVDKLNEKFSGDTSPVFYRLVEDNHVLYKVEY